MAENEKNIWDTEHPFEIPIGYFDAFSDNLNSQISHIKSNKKKNLFISISVSVIAIFAVNLLLYNQLNKNRFNNSYSLGNGEYAIFNLSTVDLIDEYELYEYIDNQNINISIFPDSLFLKDIDEDDISYLLYY